MNFLIIIILINLYFLYLEIKIKVFGSSRDETAMSSKETGNAIVVE